MPKLPKIPKLPKLPKIPKTPNTVAIIQARMTSTRLPGKVLMDIAGKPMLWRVISRLKRSRLVNEIVLAIPDTKENDVLQDFAKENKLAYYRGSENDVLSRYYEAAKQAGLSNNDVIVRITADCPLADPSIVDEIIGHHRGIDAGYTSNVITRGYPIGLDVEVFNFDVLQIAHNLAKSERHREHVTLYILENLLYFTKPPCYVSPSKQLKRPGLRLTVDTKEDLQVIGKIYEHFGKRDFSALDVIKFLDKNPQISAINSKVKQKEFISLRKAEEKDVGFLFRLRNKPYVYKYSRNNRPVEWQEHLNWSGPVIAGKTNKELFIIEYEQEPVGQLRLDYTDNQAEVSISLLKKFHGKGIALRATQIAIASGIAMQRKLTGLVAEINKDNVISQRFFKKLGFKQTGQAGEWLKYSLPLKWHIQKIT